MLLSQAPDGTDPKAPTLLQPPYLPGSSQQGLNNSWPMHTAQAWSGFLVAKLEREWRPGQLDLGGGLESH